MSADTKPLTSEMVMGRLVNVPYEKGVLYGDADNAEIGTYIVRPEAAAINLPYSGKQGYLECVGGSQFKRQIFLTSFLSSTPEMFIRTRWYSNAWSPWHKIALTLWGG